MRCLSGTCKDLRRLSMPCGALRFLAEACVSLRSLAAYSLAVPRGLGPRGASMGAIPIDRNLRFRNRSVSSNINTDPIDLYNIACEVFNAFGGEILPLATA